MGKTVAVIDGNSLMHRAYHAVPPTMNAPDGTPTHAVFGFLSMFFKFYEMYKPDAIICAFDAGKPSFRIQALEQYKAQRPPMDDELRVQFPLMEHLLEAMAVPVVKVDGWEGDDILGTLAARDEALGFNTLLVTGDKDANQLATELTHIITTKKGITDVVDFDPAKVEEKYGVTPAQFPDFLGLMGDSSDNIPGVPGIGPKTATKLLQQFGSIEGVYENLDQLKGKQKENLENNREAAFLSREIATIKRDLDFPCDVEAAAFPAFDVENATQAFGELQLNMHLHKLLGLVGASAPAPAQITLTYEPILEGADARAAVDAAVLAGQQVGVALMEPAQASLFDPALLVAIACNEGVALFRDDEASAAVAAVVARGNMVAFDAKEVLHLVYPPDTALPAQVTPAEVAAAQLFDVALAAYVLDSSSSKVTLSDLAKRYLGGALPAGEDDRAQACIHAAVLRALVNPLTKALQEEDDRGVYFDIDLPLVGVLAEMERTGAALDAQALAALGETTAVDIANLRQRIIEEAGEDFNVDSPKQLGHILFEVLNLPAKKKTSRGYSTDAGVLKELSGLHPLPQLVLKYRELAKIKSTYIDALPNQRREDGRVHTTFHQTVTATGRLSSSDPNLQNIPVRTDFGRQIRQCFVPLEPGNVFVSADYSQIELRLLAHLSGDEHLVAAFNSGEDFHAQTAARVFGLPVEQVTPQLRSRAKAVNFGIVYGQQAFGLSQSLDIPFGEAKDMIDAYFAAYPGVRTYLDDVVASAKSCGYAQTMYGRRRYIPELKERNPQRRAFGERTAMNHPMQGSAADIIKLAMVQVRNALAREGLQAQLMLQVHDELDFSAPAEEVERLSTLVRDIMEHVAQLKVPLIADVSHGPTWAEAH
ncbi:MAG: DNA polymerase I [Coriobacteriia bacterium]|nr:DNA polymerase I [Coriobacteriia bacterium]